MPSNIEHNPARSIAQLRRSLRRWRGRAIGSCFLIVLCALIIYACWRSKELHWIWYVLGGLGFVVNSLRLAAEITEYLSTKKRIEIECEPGHPGT
jgi:hypothetical protein